MPSKENYNADVVWSQEEQAVANVRGLYSARIFPVLYLLSVMGLVSISLIMVYSATVNLNSDNTFLNQTVWVSLGMLAATVTAFLPLPRLSRHALIALAGTGALLLYLSLSLVASKTLQFTLPFAPSINGAVRWIRVAGVQMQPSELAKLLIILFLARYYACKDKNSIRHPFTGVLVPGMVSGLVLFMIVAGKDLSTTVVTGMTIFAIMFYSGVRPRYLLIMMLLGLCAIALLILPNAERRSRVTSAANPEAYKSDDSSQLWHSLTALGNGGWRGRGIAKGLAKTYLPENHTDFIIATIGEELGLIGIILVLFFYSLMHVSTMVISWQCRSREQLLICCGIATLVSVQALVNIGVVCGRLPTTGVTAPYLSYGGTSMLVTLICSGIILNISRQNLRDIMNEIMSSRPTLTRAGRRATKPPRIHGGSAI